MSPTARNLDELPEGLDVWFLNASGCTKLTRFPRRARIERGGLNVNGCTVARASCPTT